MESPQTNAPTPARAPWIAFALVVATALALTLLFRATGPSDDDFIVRLDCDDTHEPEYVVSIVEKLAEGFDVVSASRFRPGGGQMGVNTYRATISLLANLFMGLVFRIPGLRDCSCGFRGYRASAVKRAVSTFGNNFIQLKGLGFTSTLEVIVKLRLLGCRFAEVPFMLRYDQKVSSSKMIASVTSLGYLIMAVLYHWPFGGWRQQRAVEIVAAIFIAPFDILPEALPGTMNVA